MLTVQHPSRDFYDHGFDTIMYIIFCLNLWWKQMKYSLKHFIHRVYWQTVLSISTILIFLKLSFNREIYCMCTTPTKIAQSHNHIDQKHKDMCQSSTGITQIQRGLVWNWLSPIVKTLSGLKLYYHASNSRTLCYTFQEWLVRTRAMHTGTS